MIRILAAVPAQFVNHMELWLSGAGVLVTWAVPTVLMPRENLVWKVAAITALSVGVLHGLIFWVVRRRQRRVRDRAIHEIRAMLEDVINNKLHAVIMTASAVPGAATPQGQKAQTRIAECARAISELVATLSEESLAEWQDRYSGLVAELTAKAQTSGEGGPQAPASA